MTLELTALAEPEHHTRSQDAGDEAKTRSRGRLWTAVAALEVAIAVLAVVLDVVVPTLIILIWATVSLVIRREGLATLGFHRLAHAWRTASQVLALTVGWTFLQLGLFLPVMEHITGKKQDLSDFNSLQGNWKMLVILLMVSWTLAAIGEELVYRGYIPTRVTDVLGAGAAGVTVAVLGSSVLFGLAHTEQGLIGVVATFLDALFFSVLRLHYRNLWASVLAHGFNNTIGLVAYFLAGPFYGLW